MKITWVKFQDRKEYYGSRKLTKELTYATLDHYENQK